MTSAFSKLHLALVPAVLAVSGCGLNSVPTEEENAKAKWANVQADYQRRADLIPNLVETVKGYAKQEQSVLVEVTNARAGMVSAKNQDEYMASAQNMDRGIKQLMIAVESYPQINSTENFKTLQAQLEGTENQVKTERDYYNEAVKQFNSYVRGFWKHKALGLVGDDDEEFKVRKMFEADAGSENAPKVSFE